jgi:hypothetical protein
VVDVLRDPSFAFVSSMGERIGPPPHLSQVLQQPISVQDATPAPTPPSDAAPAVHEPPSGTAAPVSVTALAVPAAGSAADLVPPSSVSLLTGSSGSDDDSSGERAERRKRQSQMRSLSRTRSPYSHATGTAAAPAGASPHLTEFGTSGSRAFFYGRPGGGDSVASLGAQQSVLVLPHSSAMSVMSNAFAHETGDETADAARLLRRLRSTEAELNKVRRLFRSLARLSDG